MAAPLKFAKSHEWISVENGIGTVGITAFAVKLLSDLVYIDLPAKGKQLKAGQTLGEVESVKAVSDIYAPVGGTVLEVNEALGSRSELVNEDPYGAGFIMKLQISNPGDLEALLDAAFVGALIENEHTSPVNALFEMGAILSSMRSSMNSSAGP